MSPRPTRFAAATCPFISRPAGSNSRPPCCTGAIKTAWKTSPRFAWKDETRSFKRSSRTVPAGTSCPEARLEPRVSAQRVRPAGRIERFMINGSLLRGWGHDARSGWPHLNLFFQSRDALPPVRRVSACGKVNLGGANPKRQIIFCGRVLATSGSKFRALPDHGIQTLPAQQLLSSLD